LQKKKNPPLADISGCWQCKYTIGSIMPHIGRNTLKNEGWVNWHFSVGAAIHFFIAIRLYGVCVHPVPQLPTLAPWERKLAGLHPIWRSIS
jgi:cytochrome b561